MSKLDWEDWPAWITIIVAITVPAITSVLTMVHERKMKKADIVYNQKIAAINMMCSAFDKAVATGSYEDVWALSNAVYQVSIYFDKTIAHELFCLLDKLASSFPGQQDNVIPDFRKCLILLGAEIQKQGKV